VLSQLGKRVAAALPAGMLRLGIGTAVVGLASYIHLAVAGHVLDPAGKSAVSVLWTLAFSIGYSISMPLEQEIARIVAGEVERGRGTSGVARRGLLVAAAILGVTALVLAAVSVPLADALFDHQLPMVAALGGAFAGLAGTSAYRGVLAGHGEFGIYSRVLTIDGTLRIVLAAAFAVGGVKSALWYSLILTIAPLVSRAVTTPAVRRVVTPGGEVAWSVLYRGLGLLAGSMLLSQVVLNVAVINVKLLEPGKVALVSALLAALVLARVPLFVFGALQSVLLPGLATAHASGDAAGFRALLRRSTMIVVFLGTAGGIGCVVIGPWSVRTLFGMTGEIGWSDFLWLSLGSLFYMQAMVLGQALTAQNRHRVQMFAWIAGTAALAVVTFGPGGISTRVELAYAVGSAVTTAAMACFLRTGIPVPESGSGSGETERQTYGRLAARVGGNR
jgi:O-antigen/teichoic acid export membrane protein